MRKWFGILLLGGLMLAMQAGTVVFLGSANDSDLFAAAFKRMRLPKNIQFEYYCVAVDDWAKLVDAARRADVLILSARGVELRQLAERHVDYSKTKLYALTSRLLPKEIPALEPPELTAYRENRRPENFRNMVYWIINRELDRTVKFAPPISQPEIGVTHPAAGRVFASVAAYRQWAEADGRWHPGAGVIAFAVHAASINREELALFRYLTDECERRQLNVAVVYGDEVRVIRELLLDADGRPTVDAVLALSFKFKAGLGEPLRLGLKDLDLPVFNALRLYRQTTEEWAASPQGMNDFSVAFGFIAPEISGMIEPSLLFGSRMTTMADGRRVQTSEPFPDTIRTTVLRLKKWIGLRRKKNAEKRVAFFIYNGSGGKQTIGASYLNVPRSLVRIFQSLARAGYRTGGLEELDANALTGELLRCARNIGSWAPGELDELIARGEPVRLSLARYAAWFAELPEALRQAVVAEWGAPEDAKIMVSGSDFVLPMLRRDNVIVLPEPMRGWLDDPHKLMHSATLAPPHQYLAVYLWLRHEFQADALVHLGRHGSSEWLPGKQLGLNAADAPLVVRGDIPEIYPYIVDGIGEGIVAKRRAQAVMIDHLTPFLKVPEEADFLPALKRKIADCQTADPAVRATRRQAAREFAVRAGLAAKLELESPGWWHRLEDYTEQRQSPAPFGLHAFGTAPAEAEIQAMLALLPEKEHPAAARHLRSSGDDEMQALLHALNGGFVEPGPAGDPLRNAGALPVGRNFYSFDPAKIPSPEALKTGAELANQLLDREREKHGRLPRSVAIVLWAGESIRTDGVNEGMALALLGMTLRYDRNGRVTGVVPVPGAQLGRPRIEVLITTSGAYRDQFGDLIRLLDVARRQASRLTDAENFIRRDAPGVFFPAPGTYGTRVNKLAGASGIWENDAELAAVYLKNMAYSVDAQGEFVEDRAALSAALQQVDTVMHSRSSNVYGVTDIDDMYQYLGGLALAVRQSAGRSPGTYIADLRKRAGGSIADFKSFMGGELDSRLYNPEWIRAMMQEGYSGAKTLARMTDNLWGWQAVTPENLSAADWQRLHEIYVQDRHQLRMQEFFARNNEWAFQSMTGRMLEAVRKEYWPADLGTRQSLAAEYAKSVIRQGMACCDHTCNNPLLNQMVVNLISMPGVLAPELVMKFQAAVERAGGKNLDAQVRERRALQKQLSESFGSRPEQRNVASEKAVDNQREQTDKIAEAVPVKGFRMKKNEANAEETNLASSGLRWTILAVVFLLLAIFGWGCHHRGE